MIEITQIEAFLKKHVQEYDLIIESKPSITGSAVLYRASIDKAAGGNFVTSGYEFSLEDALKELVAEIKKESK